MDEYSLVMLVSRRSSEAGYYRGVLEGTLAALKPVEYISGVKEAITRAEVALSYGQNKYDDKEEE